MTDSMLITASSMTLTHAAEGESNDAPATLLTSVDHARARALDTAKTSLVSVPHPLHFELSRAKTSEKTRIVLLYRTIWSWFTSAAERRRVDQAVDAFGRFGTSYVDACRFSGTCTFGGC
jgi:hypothetical protein